MIYIVHGEDYVKSRNLIQNQSKKNITHKTEIDIKDISPKQLLELVSNFDLFGTPPFIVLVVSNTKIADAEKYVQALVNTPHEATVIVLGTKALGTTNVFIKQAELLKAKVIQNNFASHANVFEFVDNVYYKNRLAAYKELKNLEKEDADPFYIFSMLVYGLRNITHAKFITPQHEAKSGFMKSKAAKQAELYSKENIYTLYEFFFNTDKKMKTGGIPQDVVIVYTVEKILNL